MPCTLIGDDQLGAAAAGGVGGHGYLGALGGVGEGVVEQDTNDLPHPFMVGQRDHRPFGGAQLQARSVGLGARAELAGRLAGEFAEVDAARAHHHRPGVELGEVEQIGGQLGQAFDLLAHRADELFALGRARVVLLEQLDEAAEAEDRRAQLVRGIGDELFAGGVELGEAALHLVEGAGERRELADRGDRDRRLEVAVGDFAGGLLEAPDVARGEARVVDADHQGERRGDQPADDDLGFDRPWPEPRAADLDHIYVDDGDGAEADADRGEGDAPAEAARSQAPSHLLDEAVADAAHGEEELGLLRVALDLLAQVADVDVDGARVAVLGVAPDVLEQRLAGEHAAG